MATQLNEKAASNLLAGPVTWPFVALGKAIQNNEGSNESLEAPNVGQKPQVPRLPATPAQASPHSTVSSEDGINCAFGCGPPRPIGSMTNTGTITCSRWMCIPCNGARKAIEHVAKTDRHLKASLAQLKQTDPDLWRHKVRSCRIRDSNDPGTTGVLDLNSRRVAINQLKVAIVQKIGSPGHPATEATEQ